MAKKKSKKPIVKATTGCGQEPIGPTPTPNGHWSCIDGQWEWIPEIG